jgi:predicted nucleic acid-binding Zn ribbon protein
MKKRKPQKLGDIVRSVLSERGYLKQCLEAEIITRWPELVGEKIAEVAECTDVRDGIIYVTVSSSSWRNEISFLKKEIMDKIKKETRCNTIKDILFR